jgi:hypothetical protein
MTTTELIGSIYTGALDDHLTEIISAARARQDNKGRSVATVGGTVRLRSTRGELNGALATVLKINRKTVLVELIGDDVPEYRRQWRVHPSHIEAA